MQKLKDLWAQIQTKLLALRDKIPFLKKKADNDNAAPSPAPEEPAQEKVKKDGTLAKIYRDGTLSMRIGVIFVFVFGIAFLVSSTVLGIKVFKRIKASAGKLELQQEYQNQFEGLSSKVSESASIIGLGRVIAEAYKEDGKGIASLEVWVRCDNPKTAAYVQNIDLKLHDKIIDVLKILAQEEVDLLEPSGKEKAKLAIREALNKYLEGGKILDVYFHNFVMQ